MMNLWYESSLLLLQMCPSPPLPPTPLLLLLLILPIVGADESPEIVNAVYGMRPPGIRAAVGHEGQHA